MMWGRKDCKGGQRQGVSYRSRCDYASFHPNVHIFSQQKYKIRNTNRCLLMAAAVKNVMFTPCMITDHDHKFTHGNGAGVQVKSLMAKPVVQSDNVVKSVVPF